MPQFTVCQLDMDRLDEAYPIIRSAARVSKERWEAFARDLFDKGGRILAVLAESGGVHGVAAYRRAGNLRHENGLLVEVIATFELSASARVRKALCAQLEEIAREECCQSLILTVAAGSYADPARRGMSWDEMGLEMETVNLVQKIEESPPLRF